MLSICVDANEYINLLSLCGTDKEKNFINNLTEHELDFVMSTMSDYSDEINEIINVRELINSEELSIYYDEECFPENPILVMDMENGKYVILK